MLLCSFLAFVPLYTSYSYFPQTDLIKKDFEIFNGEIEFKRGDILVKANHNNLVGTSFVENGSGFGHVAIVLKGGKDDNVMDLLERTIIFESHARDVAEGHQIRKGFAHHDGTSVDSLSLSFSDKHTGGRYLLRANLSDSDIENILTFVTDQDNCTSSWRATKDYSKGSYDMTRNWYCSLLIWQAFYNIIDKDIDVNKGLIVYPNDIVNSPLFMDNGTIIRF